MKITAVEPIGMSPEQVRDTANRFARQGHEFIYHLNRREDAQTLIERMHGADIVIVSNIPLREDVLGQCPRLKMIAVAFTGLDHIDTDYCQKHRIAVCNAAGYATEAVSELTIGLMLSLLRNLHPLENAVRSLATRNNYLGRQLGGKTVGIVGMGAIGKRVGELLQGWGCRVLAYSRNPRPELAAKGIDFLPLDDLLPLCDVISLHLPLNAETFHLFDARRLSLCSSDAILINTARGGIVDVHALADALGGGKLAGAGIDVFDVEPPLPIGHPLTEAPNCVLLPHVGYATREAFARRIEIVSDHIFAWLASPER